MMRSILKSTLAAALLVSCAAQAAPGPSGSADARAPAVREPQVDRDRTMGRAMDGTTDRSMDRDRMMDHDRMQQDMPIYGAEVMTEQEQRHYRERLRTMTSEQERTRFMAQHRAEMQARGKARGVALQEAGAMGDQDRDRDADQDRDRDRLRDQDPDRNPDKDQDRLREHQSDG